MQWFCRRLRPRSPKGARLSRYFRPLQFESLEDRVVLSAVNVTYHGGPLLNNVQVQAVYLGTTWSTVPTLAKLAGQVDGFVQYFLTSPYMKDLQQYGVGNGAFENQVVLPQNSLPGTALDDNQIIQILNYGIFAKQLAPDSPNQLYLVFTPPDVKVTAQGQDSISGFAAYHDAFISGLGAQVYYAVIPYPTGASDGRPLTDLEQMTELLSHEIPECVTDPDTSTGWFDPGPDGEISDIAVGHWDTMDGAFVQGFWSQADRRIVMPQGSPTPISPYAPDLTAPVGQPFTDVVGVFGPTVGFTTDDPDLTYTATVDWGNGRTSSEIVTHDDLNLALVVASNTYDQPGNYPFKVNVFDGNGALVGSAQGTASATAQVSPPNLQVQATSFSAAAGQKFSGVVASFPMPESNTYGPGLIDWGDGTTSQANLASDGQGGVSVSGDHTYGPSGTYNVVIQVHEFDVNQPFVAISTAHVTDNTLPSALPPVAVRLTTSGEFLGNLISKNYQQYLGRTPSSMEVALWVNAMQHGLTDEQVEAGFIGSPEYYQHAGGTNKAWVDAMYHDLLGRDPDAAGENFWLQALAFGAARSTVAYGFAASSEREGIIVQQDYQRYLGRAASAAEIASWVQAFRAGATNELIIAGFVGSGEYFRSHGANVRDWLFSAYQDLFTRQPDTFGLNSWTSTISRLNSPG